MYVVLNFKDEVTKYCNAVPIGWVNFDEKTLQWPHSIKNVKPLILNQVPPESTWKIYEYTKIVSYCGKLLSYTVLYFFFFPFVNYL